MSEWLGWCNGRLMPVSELSMPLDDLGHTQGVVVVERLRTVAGVLLDWSEHWARLSQGCEMLGIPIQASPFDFEEVAAKVVREPAGEVDCSLVIIATPGVAATPGDPTLMIYPQPIVWSKLSQLYQSGEQLVIADARNVPSSCWSPQLKTRSRLQYYLADRQVHAVQSKEAVSSGPVSGLLLDDQGAITETSTANVCFIFDGELVCPRMEKILHGVSLERTLRLAKQAGIKVRHDAIFPNQAQRADEILCSGTTGCLWHASSLRCGSELVHFDPPSEGSVFRRLQQAWAKDLGIDFVQQALNIAPLADRS